jgi:hypothetical protein
MTNTLPRIQNPAIPTASPPAVVSVRPLKIEFRTVAEVMQFAEMIQNAEGAIPKGMVGNPGKIVATVMAGHELGIGPMASLRAFHVVEGRPTADYSFWVARLKAAGYQLKWLEKTQERVTLQLIAPDGSESAPETWDKARAITAGLWNKSGPWKLYPQTMLAARAITSVGRSFAAEVMFGCYETDEVEEIMRDAEVTVTPATTTGTAAQRVAAATGAVVSDENAAIETKARECADMLRALGLGRDDLFGLLKQLAIEHTEKTRLSDLPLENLEKLAEKLDVMAAARSETPAREPGDET